MQAPPPDVICGGYPCQPFSEAGKRRGADDDRHLWPSMLSLIKKYRPTWFVGENVAGHITLGLDDVLSDLENSSYSTETFIIPAFAVDAKHRRDRVWIVSFSDANSQPRRTGEPRERAPGSKIKLSHRWEAEPAVGRVAHGIPRRVDRLRSLGNAVVPQIPEIIGHAILAAEGRG